MRKRLECAFVGDAYDDKATRVYTITGTSEFLNRLDTHLAFIQWLGTVGHSATAGIGVDGDGSDRLRVVSPKLPSIKESQVKTKGTYPEQFEYVTGKAGTL
jgi:hypothetical protein